MSSLTTFQSLRSHGARISSNCRSLPALSPVPVLCPTPSREANSSSHISCLSHQFACDRMRIGTGWHPSRFFVLQPSPPVRRRTGEYCTWHSLILFDLATPGQELRDRTGTAAGDQASLEAPHLWLCEDVLLGPSPKHQSRPRTTFPPFSYTEIDECNGCQGPLGVLVASNATSRRSTGDVSWVIFSGFTHKSKLAAVLH
jgi:hypothetical protein